MASGFDRRELLKLLGAGGVVFASALAGAGQEPGARRAGAGAGSALRKDGFEDFFFVQLSDTHWGFTGPKVNPQADTTLQQAVEAVNALPQQPAFVVFTGDLTHTTDDPAERRKRLGEFQQLAARLKAPVVRFMPGEHDAALDSGEAFRERFGATHYTFDHQGVHFVVLDNVSDPHAQLGDAQLQWLQADLARLDKSAPIVVLTHRPLFDLMPTWDWATPDGSKALALLEPYEHVTVFYGHIHQEHHFQTGHIMHHAARSLMFPLPAPGSVPKKAPVPWDAAHPLRGLGFREVAESKRGDALKLREHDLGAG